MGDDRDGLVALYDSTGGPCWKNRFNWRSEQRISSWWGVKIDCSGHVSELVLDQNRLKGRFPDNSRWKSLVNVRLLSLSGNLFTGQIPKAIRYLHNLQILNLSWNQFEGPIPDELYTLTRLQTIRIDNNKVSGTISHAISNLKELNQFNISYNNLSGNFPWISLVSLPKLFLLDISGNKFLNTAPKCMSDSQLLLETMKLDFFENIDSFCGICIDVIVNELIASIADTILQDSWVDTINNAILKEVSSQLLHDLSSKSILEAQECREFVNSQKRYEEISSYIQPEDEEKSIPSGKYLEEETKSFKMENETVTAEIIPTLEHSISSFDGEESKTDFKQSPASSSSQIETFQLHEVAPPKSINFEIEDASKIESHKIIEVKDNDSISHGRISEDMVVDNNFDAKAEVTTRLEIKEIEVKEISLADDSPLISPRSPRISEAKGYEVSEPMAASSKEVAHGRSLASANYVNSPRPDEFKPVPELLAETNKELMEEIIVTSDKELVHSESMHEVDALNSTFISEPSVDEAEIDRENEDIAKDTIIEPSFNIPQPAVGSGIETSTLTDAIDRDIPNIVLSMSEESSNMNEISGPVSPRLSSNVKCSLQADEKDTTDDVLSRHSQSRIEAPVKDSKQDGNVASREIDDSKSTDTMADLYYQMKSFGEKQVASEKISEEESDYKMNSPRFSDISDLSDNSADEEEIPRSRTFRKTNERKGDTTGSEVYQMFANDDEAEYIAESKGSVSNMLLDVDRLLEGKEPSSPRPFSLKASGPDLDDILRNF